VAKKYVDSGKLSEIEMIVALAAKKQREKDKKDLRPKNLLQFIKGTHDNYKVKWFHKSVCKAMDRILSGECKRLMVFMPPRHGKSEIISRYFPAYAFGENPNLKIISTSYSQDLASSMNKDTQDIIDRDKYKAMYPKTRLSERNIATNVRDKEGNKPRLRNVKQFEIVGHKGSYLCAGVGGSIVGKGADIILIDDPVKSQQEALSPTLREATEAWYDGTLKTRLDSMVDGAIVIINTRWHEDDLCGRKLKKYLANPDTEDEWEIISYPALKKSDDDKNDPREIGDALWEERFPAKELKKIEKNTPSIFSSQYQQDPTPEGGSVFKEHWWQFYDTSFRDKIISGDITVDSWTQSWDMTFGSLNSKASFTTGQLWCRIGETHYLIDQYKEQVGYVDMKKALKYMHGKWPQCTRILIEDKANGPAIVDDLKKLIPGLIALHPDGNKLGRAMTASDFCASGNMVLPEATIPGHGWILEFINNCKIFRGVRLEKNDEIDCMSQYINDYVDSKVPTNNVFFIYRPKKSANNG